MTEPQIHDGRNGFSDPKGHSRRADGSLALYSDKMMVDAPTIPTSKRGRGFR